MALKNIDIFSRTRLMEHIARSEKRGKSILTNATIRIISIHDTRTNPAFKPSVFPQHLVLEFDDITPGLLEQDYPFCKLATPEQAKQVVDFAQAICVDSKVQRLIVNCAAGISRSAAVATSINEIFCPDALVQAFQGEIH